jgi:DNA polymerase-3 subunit alpha
MSKILFFDTETTGLPRFRNQNALAGPDNWPDIVSIAWGIIENGQRKPTKYHVIRPDGWTIEPGSMRIHGITMDYAYEHGRNLADVLLELRKDFEGCDTVAAHNIEFDKNVLFNAYKWRMDLNPWHIWPESEFCSMMHSNNELKIPSMYPTTYRPYKPPTLTELYEATFSKKPEGLHNAKADVDALMDIYEKRWL